MAKTTISSQKDGIQPKTETHQLGEFCVILASAQIQFSLNFGCSLLSMYASSSCSTSPDQGQSKNTIKAGFILPFQSMLIKTQGGMLIWKIYHLQWSKSKVATRVSRSHQSQRSTPQKEKARKKKGDLYLLGKYTCIIMHCIPIENLGNVLQGS